MKRAIANENVEARLQQPMSPVRKYCPTCMERGVKTPVEKYHDMPLDYCTYHYWLMKAGPEGMKLKDYVKGSRATFRTSLPSSQDIKSFDGSP